MNIIYRRTIIDLGLLFELVRLSIRMEVVLFLKVESKTMINYDCNFYYYLQVLY